MIKLPKIWGLILILLTLIGCGSTEVSSGGKSLKEKEMERAIFFGKASLDGLGESGYVRWTPTTAAIQLVNTMNAAQTLTPEEEKEYRQRGMTMIPKAIPYVLNQPTAPWQVVIVADETQQKIKFLGYGTDLQTPIITEEVPCCQF